MGWGTKGQKQISFEIFSLFLAKLPPTEGSARRAKGVKLISKGIGLITSSEARFKGVNLAPKGEGGKFLHFKISRMSCISLERSEV